MAAEIVTTLKNRIKVGINPSRSDTETQTETAQENDERLQYYESEAEENRRKYEAEKRAADESEAEVLSLQRKIRLLEDRRDKLEERLETTNIQELLL